MGKMKRLESRVGGKCRPGAGLPLVWLVVLFALLSAGTKLPGQYLGGGRPMSRQEMVDSLAARLDTAAATALRAEMPDSAARVAADSNAALRLGMARGDSAKIDTTAIRPGTNTTVNKFFSGGKLDSLKINATGGGGGIPYDTTLYNYVLGTVVDSALFGGFSKFIKVTAGRNDSTAADTLKWCIDQIKATGGTILIALSSADTMFWYDTDRDSLPTIGGIAKPVYIMGLGKDITFWSALDETSIAFNFTANRHCGTGNGFLEISGITIRSYLNSYTTGNFVKFYLVGRSFIRNCRFVNAFFQERLLTGIGADSVMTVENCEFGLADATEGTVAAIGGGVLRIINCSGFIEIPDTRCTLEITGCNFRVKEIYDNSTVQILRLTGNRFQLINNGTYEGIGGSWAAYATGNYFKGDDAVDIGASQKSYFSGNVFEDCGLSAFYGMAAGNTFISSGTGIVFAGISSASTANNFYGCTTAININSQSGIVCHGNASWDCPTDISGTPATNTDNTAW
ncbi:MAG: hypothetical protein V1794_15865 [Candidatus Glassbacteria bacterium]